MMKAYVSLLTFALVFLATHLHAESHPDTTVPPATLDAIMAFHEVFEPVWYQAYPAQDIAAITERVPRLQQAGENLVEAVNANGPARLKAAAEGILASVGRLSAVVAEGDQSDILSAVEQAHDKMHVIMEQADAHGEE